MKPIKDWTHEEKDRFITLLRAPDVLLKSNYRYHNSFEEVKSFMEKEWPDLWEEYLARKMIPLQRETFTETLDDVFDLSTLVAFLLEPEQVEKWGWVECCFCLPDIRCPYCWDNNGKIKHPALIYAEGINKMQAAAAIDSNVLHCKGCVNYDDEVVAVEEHPCDECKRLYVGENSDLEDLYTPKKEENI